MILKSIDVSLSFETISAPHCMRFDLVNTICIVYWQEIWRIFGAVSGILQEGASSFQVLRHVTFIANWQFACVRYWVTANGSTRYDDTEYEAVIRVVAKVCHVSGVAQVRTAWQCARHELINTWTPSYTNTFYILVASTEVQIQYETRSKPHQ